MNFVLHDKFVKRVNLGVPPDLEDDRTVYVLNHWTKIRVTVDMAAQAAPEKTKYKAGWGYPLLRTWIDETIQGRWASYIHLFYFEDPKDAILFLLRWA